MGPWLLIPLGLLGYYIWNRNKTVKQTVLQGTSPVQVLSANYDQTQGVWNITANVTQPDGAIASMALAIAGPPTLQPTVTQIMQAAGVTQQQQTQPTSMEF
jgi:hypothetical protein